MKKFFAVMMALMLAGICSSAFALTPTMYIAGDFPDGQVGVMYSSKFDVEASWLNCTWEVVSGTTLPPGLKLDKWGWAGGDRALLTGKPTKAGVYKFTVKVSNSNIGVSNVKNFTITIKENASVGNVTIVGEFPDGVKGTMYSSSVTQARGTEPFIWSIEGDGGYYPKGLTLKGDASETVTLTGIPTETGKFTFTLILWDKYSETKKTFTMNITDSSSGNTSGNTDGGGSSGGSEGSGNSGGTGSSGGSSGGSGTGTDNNNGSNGGNTGNTGSNSNDSGGSSGGGCNAGFGILGLMIAVTAFRKK